MRTGTRFAIAKQAFRTSTCGVDMFADVLQVMANSSQLCYRDAIAMEDMLRESTSRAEECQAVPCNACHKIPQPTLHLATSGESPRLGRESFLDEMPVGLFECSISDGGVITWINRAGATVLGYISPDELIGKPLGAIFSDASEGEEFYQSLLKLGSLNAFRAVGRKQDGQKFHFELTCKLVKSPGWGPSVIEGAIRDVTERVDSDRRLSFLAQALEHAPVALVAIDAKGRIAAWNKAAEHLFGYRADQIIGKPYDTFIPHHQKESARQALRRLETTRFAKESSTERLTNNGELLPVDVTITKLTDDNGRLTGYVAALRDITEVKSLESELSDMRDQLTQSTKMAAIGQIVSSVAHDLNNPLTIITASAQMLLLSDPSEKHKKYVGRILHGAKLSTSIVEDLLSFSRKRKLKKTRVNVNDIIREAMELRAEDSDIRGVKIVMELAEDMPHIGADADQLQRTLLNIISNAEHAISLVRAPREGRVLVQTRLAPRDRRSLLDSEADDCLEDAACLGARPERAVPDSIYIYIIDNGPGIPRERQKDIFEPFFTTKPTGKGTGLGLSISRQIVEAHGGTINVESEEGKGTAFVIQLPIRPSAQTSKEPGEPEIRPPEGRRKRILVIDDEPVVRETISLFLEAKGYRPTAMDCAVEALEQIKAGTEYDYILCDVVMPRMNGVRFYETLREVNPELSKRITFMTGVVSESVEDALSAIGVSTLTKPFSLHAILGEISKCPGVNGQEP